MGRKAQKAAKNTKYGKYSLGDRFFRRPRQANANTRKNNARSNPSMTRYSVSTIKLEFSWVW